MDVSRLPGYGCFAGLRRIYGRADHGCAHQPGRFFRLRIRGGRAAGMAAGAARHRRRGGPGVQLFRVAPSRVPMTRESYSGVQNLEAMEEAVRYNRFLEHLVLSVVQGCERVLDFGAGNGTFARKLHAQGVAPVCVEPDAALRATLAAAGLKAVAAIGEVASESVDAAYSLNVLEHIDDDAGALAELRRVLRPGGR